ncbi:MAG: glycine zipper 2TM domain-containing protein [Rhodanobacteraceae bacterium]
MCRCRYMHAIVAALALSATFATSAQDDRQSDSDNVKYSWADVLRVDPVYETVQVPTPRRECEDVTVTRHDDHGNNVGGTVLGAIVGGVLGHQVGKGDGRKAATVAGAVAGGAIGNEIASRDDDYYPDDQRRCHVVDSVRDERRIAGYDVQYRYRGDVYASRLGYDPGERIRVRISIQPAE